MKEAPIYLSGLNGLRAIAAMSVVIAHISQKGIADFGLSTMSELPMAGWLSYTYFEMPFLKLKGKFAVVQSSNSMLPQSRL